MNRDKRQAAGVPVLAALVGLLAMVVLAGPAYAGTAHKKAPSQPSGGCVAKDGSVCSGTGEAKDNSVSSGNAVAKGGSVASGCSEATDNSTASGGVCQKVQEQKRPHKPGEKPGPGEQPSGEVPTAGPAAAQPVSSLAFTGSSVGPELAMAAGLLLGGLLLVRLASERRRTVPTP
jgi:hypothetical protein